ncbi:MAG: flagellar hook-basal body complex protein FliE [Chloroflexi bacterium]|nr:flagellar hook-basal body complex protein FliE [Chloroflexota bacterium]
MSIQPIVPITIPSLTSSSGPSNTNSFENVLGKAVQNLANTQQQANTQAVNLSTGQNVNLVNTMLSMEKTSVNFQLAMQVRDKVISAYQNIMQMQM